MAFAPQITHGWHEIRTHVDRSTPTTRTRLYDDLAKVLPMQLMIVTLCCTSHPSQEHLANKSIDLEKKNKPQVFFFHVPTSSRPQRDNGKWRRGQWVSPLIERRETKITAAVIVWLLPISGEGGSNPIAYSWEKRQTVYYYNAVIIS